MRRYTLASCLEKERLTDGTQNVPELRQHVTNFFVYVAEEVDVRKCSAGTAIFH